jgi:hypothetical protein
MAVGGLILKRKEIAASLDRSQYELRKLITELDAIDDAIRSFDPKVRLVPVVRPARAFCGQQRLILLELLRDAGFPVTTRQLALGLMYQRGLPTCDLKLVRQTIQKVHLTLHAMLRQGEVQRIQENELYRWHLPVPPTSGDSA